MPMLDTIAERHNVPVDAAQHLLEALARGNGTMAQFSHPALGGMGQWHAGGMTMIGDMFNDSLKARVSALCADLVPLVDDSTRAASARSAGWWPFDLGHPSTAGSQNDARYAYFPDARRLAIETDGRVKLYNTGDHHISGVSQQQGRSSDLAFSSQLGSVRLHDLQEIASSSQASPSQASPSHASPPHASLSQASPSQATDRSDRETAGPERGAAVTQRSHAGDDPLAIIERLAELNKSGVLTDAEFSAKKTELLARL